MSTIRPLATIAILAGLGIFLAHQINQSPIDEGDQLTANWGEAAPFDASAVEPPPAIAPPAPPADDELVVEPSVVFSTSEPQAHAETEAIAPSKTK